MNKPTILLGITGGIAAYKSAELTSRLKKDGFDVLVIMTKNATEFIAPLTFEVLSNNPVAVDMFDRGKPWEVEHVSWAKRADLMVVAPASANFIGKYTHGIADDMLTTTAMACKAPMLIAPAMNTAMYESPATQENIARLKERGVHFVGPEGGMLACGDVGLGRMSEPVQIEQRILEFFKTAQDLKGKRVLITSGATREPIDPVRFITNRSSGKMGCALAEECLRQGAEVLLVAGSMSVKPPEGVTLLSVETTQQMYETCVAQYPACDWAIMAAAPADYRTDMAPQKLKKTGGEMQLVLKENPDIAAALGKMKTPDQKLIVFAAETENLIENAQIKRVRKNADLLVANDVTAEHAGFDHDTNIVTLINDEGLTSLPLMSKREVAVKIVEAIKGLTL